MGPLSRDLMRVAIPPSWSARQTPSHFRERSNLLDTELLVKGSVGLIRECDYFGHQISLTKSQIER